MSTYLFTYVYVTFGIFFLYRGYFITMLSIFIQNTRSTNAKRDLVNSNKLVIFDM